MWLSGVLMSKLRSALAVIGVLLVAAGALMLAQTKLSPQHAPFSVLWLGVGTLDLIFAFWKVASKDHARGTSTLARLAVGGLMVANLVALLTLLLLGSAFLLFVTTYA